ncbi:tRNA (N(6)-L-threonylcarbamoyladenosine(37)-C(2))-methylthiotransferase MtaB [Thermovenabulum gondwanense]|uniref:Threonylcarbamoyladenosine tRNA methylthiotransferase MtaB n=1 Tax=Thermovenabulum gondwanense TaxID=520767 RepID=A0A162MBK9_9FIRM|nr:tRNA (N(6)-L-threonylcarbamoyladenosine(37)-C(2))-methylthiotransferase MtaB [Thermovenabulum gondwanense]KYO65163.1 Threonylcarbamoyladenosine tRNA methylthiotransferase MtaB [Thermovenabulum gondwanense]
MPKVAFYTLGCKVNQAETEAMMELFREKNYNIVDFDEIADIYVINTCAVTNESERKSRQIIRRAIRNNPLAVIAVVGCYSQLAAEEIMKIQGVDVVIGTRDRNKIVELVEKALFDNERVVRVSNIMEVRSFEEIAFRGFRQKTRAFLKIQEGCNLFCSYCIIPYARGPIRSRKMESIIKEAQELAKDGFKEVVLTGIHLGLYGEDFKKDPNLLDVVKEISKIPVIERIRLSSIEIFEIDRDFIQEVSKLKNFCRHFHIPLQSGSNEILKKMNRRYTTEEFLNKIEMIQAYMPDVAITTDVITGFPGEKDENFKETLEFIKKVGFSKLHVFKFSAKKGTPAYEMKEQIPERIKEERSKILIELSHQLEKDFREKFKGKILRVLFEEETQESLYEGFTDNYIRVAAFSGENLHNKIYSVLLKENGDEYILGEVISR